jgi:hypothetical protein
MIHVQSEMADRLLCQQQQAEGKRVDTSVLYSVYTRDSTFLCMRDRSNHVQQYQSNNQSLDLSIAVRLPCISKFNRDDAGYIYCAPDIDSRKQQTAARLSHLDLAIASRLLLMRVLYCTTYTDCSYCHYIPIPRNS